MHGSTLPFSKRLKALGNLAEHLEDKVFQQKLIDAYIRDTAFTRTDVLARELITPSKLLRLESWNNPAIELEAEITNSQQQVAVMVPKNSLGLTLGKAIASSFLLGHKTIVRMPQKLVHTTPIYAQLLAEHFPSVCFAQNSEGGSAFLKRCFTDEDTSAVVIYGDDAWIDPYWDLAESTRTKLLFEGPGSDPLIVMPDANINEAVDAAIRGGLNNGGQSCSAFERFFVHKSILKSFIETLRDRLQNLKLGSPLDAQTQLGPISSKVVLSRIRTQIDAALEQGATLEWGAKISQSTYEGLPLLEPTILSGCTSQMDVVRAETFGPVFPILGFDSIQDLLPSLDDTSYGLNAAVFGTCPAQLWEYLDSCHRNVYLNSTPVDAAMISTRMVDGGFRRSGFVWEEKNGTYQVREGRRFLVNELGSTLENKSDFNRNSKNEIERRIYQGSQSTSSIFSQFKTKDTHHAISSN